VEFRSSDAVLRGMLHMPAGDGDRRAAVVICPPFAEEKKCAQRVLVHAARALAQAGFVVLRFDLSGTGESTGDPAAGCPSRWREDIERAIEFVWQATDAHRLGLLGLRLGGTLAAEAATGLQPEWLVLWEPVVNGRRYLQLNVRRSLIKKMLTQGEQFDAKQAAGKQRDGHEDMDFDGHFVSARCQDEISSVDMLGSADAAAQNVFLLGIGPRDTLSREQGGLVEAYDAAGAKVTGAAVREPPFWSLVGLVRGDAAIRETLAWLNAEGGPGDAKPDP